MTHCIDAETSQQVLMREYWAYQLYQHLTPHSFKVHLVNIIYVDTQTEERIENLAFLIENNKEMARRLGRRVSRSIRFNRIGSGSDLSPNIA